MRRRRAIVVSATRALLAVRTIAGRLEQFAQLDLILSGQDLSRAVVTKVWRHGDDGEVILDKLDGGTLSDVLAPAASALALDSGASDGTSGSDVAAPESVSALDLVGAS